jgi:hypothetical protein
MTLFTQRNRGFIIPAWQVAEVCLLPGAAKLYGHRQMVTRPPASASAGITTGSSARPSWPPRRVL